MGFWARGWPKRPHPAAQTGSVGTRKGLRGMAKEALWRGRSGLATEKKKLRRLYEKRKPLAVSRLRMCLKFAYSQPRVIFPAVRQAQRWFLRKKEDKKESPKRASKTLPERPPNPLKGALPSTYSQECKPPLGGWGVSQGAVRGLSGRLLSAEGRLSAACERYVSSKRAGRHKALPLRGKTKLPLPPTTYHLPPTTYHLSPTLNLSPAILSEPVGYKQFTGKVYQFGNKTVPLVES